MLFDIFSKMALAQLFPQSSIDKSPEKCIIVRWRFSFLDKEYNYYADQRPGD